MKKGQKIKRIHRIKSAKSADKKKVAIIGAGRVGTALGLALKEKGYPIVGVASRTLQSARRGARLLKKRADMKVRPYIQSPLFTTKVSEAVRDAQIVFITTPEREIKKVVKELALGKRNLRETLVIHTSGALGVEVLNPLKKVGMPLLLAMHPIQTFSNQRSAISNQQLKGCYFGLEGEGKAVRLGKKIVKDLGGIPIVIPKESRVLYHTSASIASNYLVTLIDLALRAYEEIGIPQKKGFKMLLPLIQGTLENIEILGIPGALTGPIERGEVEILSRQLNALKKVGASRHGGSVSLPLFIELGRRTLKLTKLKGGLSSKAEREIGRLLKNQFKLKN
ncbi:DUF2520 domain-containing protein [candidate division TA06 bacterium]|nr:DUF2520 domain-containing protein [candidate division TA06 bacterium]